jgi:hypothetical protein
MTDITDRLRTWCHAPNAASAQDLMDEAAAYINCLRMALGETLDGKRNPRMSEALKLWESFGQTPVTNPRLVEPQTDIAPHPKSDRIYVSSTDAND